MTTAWTLPKYSQLQTTTSTNVEIPSPDQLEVTLDTLRPAVRAVTD